MRLRWWNDHLGGPFPRTTTRRLQTLRGDIYDFLEDELGRMSKNPVRTRQFTLPPADPAQDLPVDDLTDRTINISDRGARLR